MATINRSVTELELKEVYNAVVAIQCEKGHSVIDAKETARLLSYAVFRDVLTYESVIKSIVSNAERIFTH